MVDSGEHKEISILALDQGNNLMVVDLEKQPFSLAGKDKGSSEWGAALNLKDALALASKTLLAWDFARMYRAFKKDVFVRLV